MPLKPCQRPVRNAVMPRRIHTVTPPSPYALGAPAPSSGGRVHQQCCHYRHLLSLLRRLAKLSGDARPDGRLPAFAWGHVARGRNPYPPHYRMAFASSILLLPHVYQLALRFAFPCGRRTGLPCSHSTGFSGKQIISPCEGNASPGFPWVSRRVPLTDRHGHKKITSTTSMPYNFTTKSGGV